ncbi:hypothetical protein [Ferribacterium limneticum]|uniref:hypothetical protein n=1 Tax=Ferribacterium limneticum TaxID=76259 RepID=UPI001CF92C0A|nr:hypothetical protein [Ferribacterium limneticum]UCV22557.1 hypothetical protein KI613_18920 [Ferribacterium limneticum]
MTARPLHPNASSRGNAYPRKLDVLVVDDQLPDEYEHSPNLREFINIQPIRSWNDVQHCLSMEGELNGADILLVDVSFDKDANIAGAKATNSDIVPVGPLFALPFVGKRTIISCVVYSGHMASLELRSHPFFLLSMGLILSRISPLAGGNTRQSSFLNLRQGTLRYDQELLRFSEYQRTTVPRALDTGIEDYRERLCDAVLAQQIAITNRETLLAAIREIASACGQVGDALALDIVGANWRDRISVRSLFADAFLQQGRRRHSEVAEQIAAWLNTLCCESTFTRALNVIKAQDEEEDRHAHRPAVSDVIEAIYPDLSALESTEVLRMVVLFANIYAIESAGQHGRIMKSEVRRRLAHQFDENSYRDLFGARSRNRREGRFNTLSRFVPGSDYLYLFEDCRTKSVAVTQSDYDAVCKYRNYEEFDSVGAPTYPSYLTIQQVSSPK